MHTNEQLVAAVNKYGTKTEAARQLGIPRTTMISRLSRAGIMTDPPVVRFPRYREKPKLTYEALHEALQPPNTCRVAAFRETLDEESQAVFDEALGYRQKDFPASKLHALLLKIGFSEKDAPGTDAISAHRAGRRPCRCKG